MDVWPITSLQLSWLYRENGRWIFGQTAAGDFDEQPAGVSEEWPWTFRWTVAGVSDKTFYICALLLATVDIRNNTYQYHHRLITPHKILGHTIALHWIANVICWTCFWITWFNHISQSPTLLMLGSNDKVLGVASSFVRSKLQVALYLTLLLQNMGGLENE